MNTLEETYPILKTRRNRKQKQVIRITIILSLASLVVILIFAFHYLDTINGLLNDYNRLVNQVNWRFNTTYSKERIWFFRGEGGNIAWLLDILLTIIFFLIGLMVFLAIHWIIKDIKEGD